MRRLIGKVARWLPGLGRVLRERDSLRNSLWVPPGHFYSPIPSPDEVRRDRQRIFHPTRARRANDLNAVALGPHLDALRPLAADLPYERPAGRDLRYSFPNGAYSYSDALLYACLLRHLRPRRVIEVGSGSSSCLLLDVNELYLDGGVQCTFIEPYPQKLLSLIRPRDRDRLRLHPTPLQDVNLSLFQSLEPGDVLFIDSTHVCKTGSDVHHLLFRVLPSLRAGVWIHIHDIFYPFEYPPGWVLEGRAWNEAYALRAFLQYNNAFRIRLFDHFLKRFHRARFSPGLTACLEHGGGSIWLRKEV